MTRLTFITDIHYYSKSLGTSGKAYELRSGSDQKCLAQTQAIVEAAFEKLSMQAADAVLIAGDVTNNGEMVSHIEFREKIEALSEKIPVYLITSTHDWCCDKNPRRFVKDKVFSDVETMPHEALRKFYYEFGPKQAIAEYITHLGTCSYVLQISKKVRVIALSDDQNGKGQAGYTREHFDWILKQIEQAKKDKQLLIGMQHHLLQPHISELVSGGSCIGDRDNITEQLADAGLRIMVVGHSHLHRTKKYLSKSGNELYEINVGSLCGYPAPMLHMQIEEDNIEVKTEYVGQFVYNGEWMGEEDLRKHATDMLFRLIESAAAENRIEFFERLSALFGARKARKAEKKYGKLFFLIRKAAEYCLKADLANLLKKLNLLTFGRAINKRYLPKLKKVKIQEVIKAMICSTLDGSRIHYKRTDAYYIGVMAVVAAPYRFIHMKAFKVLIQTADELLTGGRINSNNFQIKL